jgi:hypothetical protein
MKLISKIDKGVVYILVLMFLLLCFFYGDTFLHPNAHLFSVSGDGLKNYYTYSYYISNNSSWINFEGMNYPYGEHFLYTDCTPIVAVTVRSIAIVFPGILYYQIGILNGLIFASIFLSAIFLYFIFRRLNVQFYLAVFSSVAFTFLSPQIFRLTGHLALGMSCFIPMAIYLLLRFQTSNSHKHYYFAVSIFILFWLLIHAYLGVIVFSLFFTFFTIQYFFERKTAILKFKYKWIYLSLFTPLILFNLFVFLTDKHTGRTTNPFGFFNFYSTLNSVFVPTHGSINRFLSKFISTSSDWETLSYIGLFSIFVFISIVIKSIIKSIHVRRFSIDPIISANSFIKYIFYSSVVILLFSMCIPFRFKLEFLLDYVNVLKQFRAIGRFAWVFYFSMAIVSVYYLNYYISIYHSKKKFVLSNCLILLIPSVVFYESIEYHEETSSKICETSNVFHKERLSSEMKLALFHIENDKYQAILPFPYYYIGSENYLKYPTNSGIFILSKLISYHVQLPLMSSFLSRTSLWESKNLMQLFAPDFYDKKIKKDIKFSENVLIVTDNSGEFSKEEIRFISLSKCIYKTKQIGLYSLQLKDLFSKTNQIEFESYKTKQHKLKFKNGFNVSDASLFFKFYDFENSLSNNSINGNGAYKGLLKEYSEIISISSNSLEFGRKYKIRFWVYNGGDNFGQDRLSSSVFIINHKTKKWISTVVSPMTSITIDGDWSLVEISFEKQKSNEQYDLLIKGDDYSKMDVIIDDLLIYDSELDIYKEYNKNEKSYLFYNNNQFIVTKKSAYSNH